MSDSKYRRIESVVERSRELPRPRRADPVELWGPEPGNERMGVCAGDDDYYGAVLDRAGALQLARAILELWGFTAADLWPESVTVAWYLGDDGQCRACGVRSDDAGQRSKCPACGYDGRT